MTTHFDFHYAKYKQASQKMADQNGLDVADFKRWDAIREASATAIAHEAGLIDHIPANGKMGDRHWREFQLLIAGYEVGEMIAALESRELAA